MTPPAWLTKTVALVIAIGVAVLLIAGLLLLNQCSQERRAKTEIKLATGQAQASLQSGQDAVAATGTVEGNSSASDALTKANGDTIQNAQGANVAVAAPVRDAGIAALCRRPSYRDNPRCKK